MPDLDIKFEAQRLTNLGYVRIKGHTNPNRVSRLDRPDWLNTIPSDMVNKDFAAYYYVRYLSQDIITVDRAVYLEVPAAWKSNITYVAETD